MSGLEKFEKSEDWLNRLRAFLNTNRTETLKTNKNDSSSSGASFDLDEEFCQIIEAKRKTGPNHEKENKENQMPSPSPCNVSPFKTKMGFPFSAIGAGAGGGGGGGGGGVTTFNAKETQFSRIGPLTSNADTNDSFLYLESICNKSLSDPDSTLFNYMHSLKERTDDSIKPSETFGPVDEDDNDDSAHALKSKLSELNFNDQTQLCDIVEPSGLWDSTIVGETNQISPMKMVGLMRPSTILEESSETQYSNESSSTTSNSYSFRTAPKSDETSISYKTAGAETVNSDFSRSNIHYENDPTSKYLGAFESGISEQLSCDSLLTVNSSNVHNNQSSVFVDSLNSKYAGDEAEKSKENTDSYIEISDDDVDEEERDLNKGFSIQSIPDQTNEFDDETLNDSVSTAMVDLNISKDFNDTIEEVEYIMQQGIKHLNNGGAVPKLNTPLSAHKNETAAIAKELSGTKLFYPSFTEKKESFKMPANSSAAVITRIPQLKFTALAKSLHNYSNIVSPVGAYIKNTAKTPKIANMRSTTTIKSLDYGLSNQQMLKSQTNLPTHHHFSKLPKKAYLSAKHHLVRDERTPLHIPGGPKIHKYLQPALVPCITRHDGKMKTSPHDADDQNRTTINTTVDTTLADFSMVSGDMSLYTLRDAGNFDK